MCVFIQRVFACFETEDRGDFSRQMIIGVGNCLEVWVLGRELLIEIKMSGMFLSSEGDMIFLNRGRCSSNIWRRDGGGCGEFVGE